MCIRDRANTPPAPSFTATCAGLTCSVDASASSDPDGAITAYQWSFGDGTTGSGATATHGYGQAGTYPVTLTVTDAGGPVSYTPLPAHETVLDLVCRLLLEKKNPQQHCDHVF